MWGRDGAARSVAPARVRVARGGSICNAEDLLRLIGEHVGELRVRGVSALYVFDSTARGTASPVSDVDLLVEFDEPGGLFRLAELQVFLEELLGRAVDLVPRASLRPALRERVWAEAVRAA